MEALSSDDTITHDDMVLLCNQQHGGGKPVYDLLYDRVVRNISRHIPLIPLLQMCKDYRGLGLEECVTQACNEPTSQVTNIHVDLYTTHNQRIMV